MAILVLPMAASAATEFVSVVDPDMGSGYDYASLSSWESGVQTDLTAAGTKVFSGAKTGTINDNASVTGAISGATATVVHATAAQILLENISGTFQSGEQIRVDVSNYFTASNAGDSAIAVAKCRTTSGTADTSAVTIAGWGGSPGGTSATNYIKIYTDPSENYRHQGKWDNTKYRLTVNGDAIRPQEANVEIDGLQIDIGPTTAGSAREGILVPLGEADVERFVIKNNIITQTTRAAGNNCTGIAFTTDDTVHSVYIVNNIIYNIGDAATDGNCIGLRSHATSTTFVANNTVFGCNDGFHEYANVYSILKNNIAYNNQDNYFGSYETSSTSNLSGPAADAQIPATAARNGVTVTFVSTAGGSEDFHLQSTDTGALNYGANLSADGSLPFSTDVDGQSRTAGPWDIGADEASPNGNFTLSAWVKPATSIATKAIVGKAEELRLATNASSQPLCQIKNNGTWQTAATSSEALTVGEWAQVMCTYDKIALRIYVDGILKGEQALTVSADDTNSIFEIGHDASSGSTYGYYSGLVDSFRFFTYAMTEAQAKTEFNFGKSIQFGSSGATSGTGAPTNAASGEYCVPGDTTSCAPPIAEWLFNEKVSGDAQTLYDTSGNGNNGTSNDGGNNTGMDCAKPGKIGAGCEFDGVDDGINIQTLNVGTVHSFSAWIDWRDAVDGVVLGRIGSAGSTLGYLLYIDQTDVYYNNGGNSGADYVHVAHGGIPSGRWTHFYMVRNGTAVTFYKNGVKLGATQTLNTNTALVDLEYIGRYENGDYPSMMKLDQVRVYNYARTPAQVAWEYNKGKPIAHWKMDECSGDTLHDESGNGINGTITLGGTGQTQTGSCVTSDNTPWYNGRTGKFGASLNFDGTNDYVSYANQTLYESLANITVSAWVKPTMGGGSWDEIVTDFGTGNGDAKWWMGLDIAGGQVEFGIQPLSCSYNYFEEQTAKASITSGTWHHVVGTYDGTNIRMYLDGNLRDTVNYATGMNTCGGILYIGALNTGSPSFFYEGQIDDVRIYNYALTEEQIRQVMNEATAVHF